MNRSVNGRCALDPQALDRLGQWAEDKQYADEYGPFERALQTVGRNALQLSKPLIHQLVPNNAYNKAIRLVKSGRVRKMACDGELFTASVEDEGAHYQPALNVQVTNAACGCQEIRSNAMCSHVTALMLAWNQNFTDFLPPTDAPADRREQFMASTLGVFFQQVTGLRDYQLALPRLCELLTGGPKDAPAEEERQVSTGIAYWPQARLIDVASLPLHQIIDQEYNATQLRDLSRWLEMKPKGTAKSGLIDQVVETLEVRVKRMRQNPDAPLEGLSEETAAFARRLLTARDYQLPVPRTLARKLWASGLGDGRDDQEKAFSAALDELRRRAVLFPTLRRYDYRDVYYQWLPLAGSGGSLPLTRWPQNAILYTGTDAPAEDVSDTPHFLDTMNMFVNAVLTTGTQVRATMHRHPKTNSLNWLRDWEHHVDEAEKLFSSRPGWAPHPQSGMSVPLVPWLSREAAARLENQTGLPAVQCVFLFDITAALQLIDAPDPLSKLGNSPDRYVPLKAPWRLNARLSAIEGWYAKTDEDKYTRAFDAWHSKVLFGYEVWRAEHAQATGPAASIQTPSQSAFTVMRSISAPEFVPGDLSAEWGALRRFVLRALRGLPTGVWVDWPAFRNQLFHTFPGLPWQIVSPDTWWFSDKQNRLDLDKQVNWDRTAGAMIEAMLVEPLRWFGVVETLGGPPHPLRAFRTTEVLAWLAQSQLAEPGETPMLPARLAPRPQQVEAIAWLDDMQWRLPPAPDRSELITFAHRIAEPAGTRFVYKLTPASIERALLDGINVEDAIGLFESFHAPMPQAAQSLFRTIAERFGRVRVYESLSVLELADDYALRELMSSTSLKQHVVYQISPRAVVVDTNAIDALMAEMASRGYTPGEA